MIFKLQVEISALFQRVEGTTKSIIRPSYFKYLRAIFYFALPPALMEKVCAIRHDLVTKGNAYDILRSKMAIDKNDAFNLS